MPALNYAQAYSQALAQAYPYVLHFAALRSAENDSRYRWVNANTIQIPSLKTTGRVDADRDTIGVAKRNFDNVTGSQSNGGMVCRKDRPWSYVVGAVRPRLDREDEDMDIDKLLKEITDKQAYELLEKAQRHAAVPPAPDWAMAELQEAIGKGITDGSRPMGLAMRYETAIMTKRAVR